MFKKISSKLLSIFALMLIALILNIVTSFIALDTQEQHMVLTDMLGEQNLMTERVVFKTLNIAEIAIIDELDYKIRIRTEKKNIEDYEKNVNKILSELIIK